MLISKAIKGISKNLFVQTKIFQMQKFPRQTVLTIGQKEFIMIKKELFTMTKINKIKKILAGAAAALIGCQALFFGTALNASAAIQGDVSGNGKIDLQDVIIIAGFILRPNTLTAAQQKTADYNGDGRVNLQDVIGIAGEILSKSKPANTVDSAAMQKINEVVRLVNAERAKKGISPVKLNTTLMNAAMRRAKEIKTLFSHDRPDGSSCFTVLDEYKISYGYCGENIAYGYGTPENVMNGWVNSSGHYANIMNSSYKEIGVGYYQDHWVQLFIG